MLNEMRLGKLSNESIETFRSLKRPLAFDDDFEATELYVYMSWHVTEIVLTIKQISDPTRGGQCKQQPNAKP